MIFIFDASKFFFIRDTLRGKNTMQKQKSARISSKVYAKAAKCTQKGRGAACEPISCDELGFVSSASK